MQKLAVAFYLVIFFNNTTLTQAAETNWFPKQDDHTIAKQLNEPLLFSNIFMGSNPTITYPSENVFSNAYKYPSSIQINLGTDRNLSFTTSNNGEQCVKGMRFFSCSSANISCQAVDTNGILMKAKSQQPSVYRTINL